MYNKMAFNDYMRNKVIFPVDDDDDE